jgi:type IV pilus assembly protein PilW
MASNWGRHSRGASVEGRSLPGDDNPDDLSAPNTCGLSWALNLGQPLEGQNNNYALGCAAKQTAQANSDNVTSRRATVTPTAPQNGRLQIQTTRVQGQIFDDGAVPSAFDPARSETHDLLVNSYYVDANSELIPGVPTLRRKSLAVLAGAPAVQDQEVAPGVENMQLQFGVDVDADNTVDRYVNPGDAVITPGVAGYIPGSRVITARIWLLVRSVSREPGLVDTRNYRAGDVDLGTPNDGFRRLLVSKTILLRNARS